MQTHQSADRTLGGTAPVGGPAESLRLQPRVPRTSAETPEKCRGELGVGWTSVAHRHRWGNMCPQIRTRVSPEPRNQADGLRDLVHGPGRTLLDT